MTKSEFIERRKAYLKASGRPNAILLIRITGVIILLAALVWVLAPKLKGAAWAPAIPLGLLSSVIFLGVIHETKNKKRAKQLGLTCPHCDARFVGVSLNGELLMVSGKCCRCGEQVFSDEDKRS